MDKTKEEIKKLFEEHLELGNWANAQAMIEEMSNSDVLLASEMAVELRLEQAMSEEAAHADEQMRHKEEPLKEY